MKKRVLIALSLILTLALCLSISACSQLAGKSAYDIAVDHGFVGTEQEWLDSLKGKNGTNGINGQDAAALDIYELYDAFLENSDDENATFNDFLQTLSVTGTDDQYAAAKAVRSVVSIFSTFTQTATAGDSITSTGAGSGVIYKIKDETAYIITNYHVVFDKNSSGINGIAGDIQLYTYGRQYSGMGIAAEFVGGSMSKDIAVLSAAASDFVGGAVAAELGDSNQITLAQRVFAIGNPSAEGISVTTGTLSVDSEDINIEALDSSGYYPTQTSLRVMRTDTPINKGNSGGGLFNSRGQLVGIVNAKVIKDGVENIGYAIPSAVALGIADSVTDGNSTKCLIGIEVRIDDNLVVYNSALGTVEIVSRLAINSVSAGALADGQLLAEDVLTAAKIGDGDTMTLTRLFHLSDMLYAARLGDTITLEIERAGTPMTITLTPSAANFLAI